MILFRRIMILLLVILPLMGSLIFLLFCWAIFSKEVHSTEMMAIFSFTMALMVVFGFISVYLIKKSLKHLEEMKSNFVLLASHQLRTPLTGTKWFIELLLRDKAGCLTQKQREFLEKAYQGNEQMICLVDKLLNTKLKG